MATDKSTIDARRRLVERAVRDGLSERQIAEKLGVSRTTVWADKQVLAAKAGV